MEITDRTEAIVLIGDSATGKTVYGAQLLSRVQSERGQLRFTRAPRNIRPFEDALRSLNRGLAPTHTPLQTYKEIVMPLRSETLGNFELAWPDYGGEQIRQMLDKREVPAQWCDRLKAADGWLLVIRPDQLRDFKDIISNPIEPLLSPPETAPSEAHEWSDQAKLVELMQFLLYARRVDLTNPLATPCLGVVLTCFDELVVASEVLPRDVLKQRAPVIDQFIHSNFEPPSVFVMGVSAQGRALQKDEPDTEYVDLGPEHFGYVIDEDGSQTTDLAVPLIRLIQNMRCR